MITTLLALLKQILVEINLLPIEYLNCNKLEYKGYKISIVGFCPGTCTISGTVCNQS